MTFYIIIRGYVGIGKTTVARRLAEGFKGDYVSIDRVLEDNELDRIEGGCIPEKNFIKANDLIAQFANSELNAGKPVVIEGDFYHKYILNDLTDKIRFKSYIFTLKADLEDCISRDKKREKGIGEEGIRAVAELTERFDAGKVIDATGKTPDDTISEILMSL